MRTFIKNYLHFIKNCIRPPVKKLKSLKSGFIKNSNFENNRVPCSKLMKNWKYWMEFCSSFASSLKDTSVIAASYIFVAFLFCLVNVREWILVSFLLRRWPTPCCRLMPVIFLAVQDSSIGDLVSQWVSESETFDFSDFRALQWLQWHYSDTTVTLQWHYSDTTVTLQWH